MSYQPIKIKSIKALHDHVLVQDMNFGERFLNSGIVMLGDDGKTSGIRPRWAKVFAVGGEQRDVQVGQWVLVAHGRWTRGTKVEVDDAEVTIRRVDPNDILLVSDDEPVDESFSGAVQVEAKSL